MPPHLLQILKYKSIIKVQKLLSIQKYYQNATKINAVYSRNNLPKIKDWTYVKNLDGNELIESLWIALYVNTNNIVYFHCFRVEHIPPKIKIS